MATDPFAPYAAAHASTNGPGDARPTALQIIEDDDLVGKMSDKVMFITGCSSGIGIETARALKATGARLFVTARDLSKGEKALHDVLEPGKVELLALDLDSLDSVRECAKEFLSKSKTLNVLINNAGVMALPKNVKTADGFESHFGTNHLAHFLLFQLLKSTLLASSTPEFNSRVVCVSSRAHRNSKIHFDDLGLDKEYSPRIGYGQSKTANIYMANEIERRYGFKGLHGYSLHPGGIWTGLQIHMDTTPYKGNPESERGMKSPAQGAATTVWAAVATLWEGKGGKYLEDCRVSNLVKEGYTVADRGHESWVYDEESSNKLWVESCKMVGVSDDD